MGGENLVTLPLKQVLDLPSDSERVRDCLMVPCRVLQNMGNCSPCSLTDIFNQFFPFLSVKIHSQKITILKYFFEDLKMRLFDLLFYLHVKFIEYFHQKLHRMIKTFFCFPSGYLDFKNLR